MRCNPDCIITGSAMEKADERSGSQHVNSYYINIYDIDTFTTYQFSGLAAK